MQILVGFGASPRTPVHAKTSEFVGPTGLKTTAFGIVQSALPETPPLASRSGAMASGRGLLYGCSAISTESGPTHRLFSGA
jgi:hypothetical protein